MDRRNFLASTGSLISASVAGCTTFTSSRDTHDKQGYEVNWAIPIEGNIQTIISNPDSIIVNTFWQMLGVDRSDGNIIWTLTVDKPSDATCYYGESIVHDSDIYAITCNRLLAADAREGKELWSDSSLADINGWPVINPNKDILYLPGPELLAYQISEQAVSWKTDTYTSQFAKEVINYGILKPVFTDYGIFTVNTHGEVLLINEDDGEVIWRHTTYPSGDGSLTRPVLQNDNIIVGKSINKFNHDLLFALDPKTGNVQWESSTPSIFAKRAPSAAGNNIYFSGADNHVYAHSAITGEKTWSGRVNNDCSDCWIVSDPITANNTVFVASKQLVAFDAKTGRVKWRMTTNDGLPVSPIVRDSTLYFADTKLFKLSI